MHSGSEFRQAVQSRLQGFEVRTLDGHNSQAAAVAVAITECGRGAELPGMPVHTEWSDEAALVVTRRAMTLRRHAGQWALPGGRIDAGETAEQAALREMTEEVALCLDPSAILGRLDDYATRSGFVITPVVVWAGAANELQAQQAEVHSAHRLPVAELLRADAPMLSPLPGSEHPVLRMPVGHSWIAAPTAAILFQFSEVCLRNRPTRVAHYEQPTFAWR
jgi:8-oxo-dGTP pyrophosphatase MutT (NUDIX family)